MIWEKNAGSNGMRFLRTKELPAHYPETNKVMEYELTVVRRTPRGDMLPSAERTTLAGIEPAANGVGGHCSTRMSYEVTPLSLPQNNR